MKKLENICKKYPVIFKHFKYLEEKDDLFDIDIVEEIMDLYVKEKNILKNMKFNILEYEKVEKIYDAMNEKIRYGKINVFLNNQTSLKSRGQINKKTFGLLNKILLAKISLNELSEVVFNKISAFEKNNSLNEAIEKFLKSKIDNNVRLIYENAKKDLNIDLLKINEDDNVLVLKINDFNASKNLGSVSWCISRTEGYWNSYVKDSKRYSSLKKDKLLYSLGINNGRNQVFIWDLNNPNEMETMIGLTYDKEYKKCYAGHLKNDEPTNIRLKKYLTQNEINRIKNKNKNKTSEVDEIIKSLSRVDKNKNPIKSYINDFFDVDEYENEYIERYINKKKENDSEIMTSMNSFLLKKYNNILIPKKDFIVLDDWIETLKKATKIFPEKMSSLLKASKLLEFDIIIKDEKNFLKKIEEYSEVIESINSEKNVIFKKDYLLKKVINNLKKIRINNDSERLILKKFLDKNILDRCDKKSKLFIVSNFNNAENISFIKEFINNGLDFEYFKDRIFLSFLNSEKNKVYEDYFFSKIKNIKMNIEIFEFINDNNFLNKEIKEKLLYKMINESSKENLKNFLLINKNNKDVNNVLSNVKIDFFYNIDKINRDLIIGLKLKNKIDDLLSGDKKFLEEIKKNKKIYMPVIKDKYPGIFQINSILTNKNDLKNKPK